MGAILLAILSSLSWGTADFLGGTLSRRLPVLIVLGVSQTFGLVVMLVVVAVTGAWEDPTGYVPWAIASAAFGATGLGLFYKALAIGTMSVVSPITALGGIVPVLWGIASGERPSMLAVVGIVLALVGVVAASGPEISGNSGVRPLVLAVGAAVAFGATLVCFAKGSEVSAVMTITGTRVVNFFVFFCFLVAVRPALGAARRDIGGLMAIGLFDVGANLGFSIASTMGLLAVTSVLGSLYPVVTVILAAALHHERLSRLQYAGVTLAMAGVAALSLG